MSAQAAEIVADASTHPAPLREPRSAAVRVLAGRVALSDASPEVRRAVILHLVPLRVRRRFTRTYVRTRWWR